MREEVMQGTIFVGGGGENYATPQRVALEYANRHGLIAGVTGTGKTVTLQILAEEFSRAGVPVFLSDVKGNLSGLAKAGSEVTNCMQHSPSEPLLLDCKISPMNNFRVSFGIFLAKTVIQFARPSPKWDLCCSRSSLN